MRVVGKCPPEKKELEKARQRGFNDIELYLEREHLEKLNRTVENVQSSGLNVVSVHTPHVHIDNDKAYFILADELADRLDAFLVFHSQYMHHVHIPQLEELDIEADYGYENNPGASLRHVEENILKKGYPMVLDTAHFYMAEEDYLEGIEYLLENYNDQIHLIHLCDSTKTEDGLPFGEGDMDMERTSRTIDSSNFDNIMVLEVMPGHQKDAFEKFQAYTT